jgi:glutathione S-transferase
MPMSLCQEFTGVTFNDNVNAEINRMQAIWRDTQRRFPTACGEGPFLMGAFSAVDAMFAPVASRFTTFGITLESEAQAYVDAIMAHPFMIEWIEAAHREPWIIPEFETHGGEE